MRFALQVLGYAVGLPLEVLIIAAILRGPYRRFPFIFAYTIACFLATAIEIPAYWAYYTGNQQALRSRAWLYWFNERVLLSLLFLAVLGLIWQATNQHSARRILRAAIIAGAILFATGSFAIHYNPKLAPGEWMTPWTRDLNFGSAILDLALWAMLIASKKRDYLVLQLSGGLGIQFTGEAIGQAIRNVTIIRYGGPTPTANAILLAGNVIIMAANLVCLYIWWQAFRRAGERTPKALRQAAAKI